MASKSDSPKGDGGSKIRLTLLLCLALVVVYMAQGLLITYSKNADGTYDYDKTTSVALSEMCKFGISGTILLYQMSRRSPDQPRLTSKLTKAAFRFAVPAALYALHNWIIFMALELLTPVSYQLFNNIKIITTGLVFRLFMGKSLRMVQWLAIVLLPLGMCVTQLGKGGDGGSSSSSSAGEGSDAEGGEGEGEAAAGGGGETPHQRVLRGFMWMTLLSLCSAFAGVYNEHLLKKGGGPPDSLMWKNLQLYFFSILTCAVTSSLSPGGLGLSLKGFGPAAWCVVLLNGVLGQIISLIFFYADNIVKVYAASMAVLFTPFVSNYMFGTELSFSLFVGIAVAIVSLIMYFAPGEYLFMNDDVLMGMALTKRGQGKKVGLVDDDGETSQEKEKLLAEPEAEDLKKSDSDVGLSHRAGEAKDKLPPV